MTPTVLANALGFTTGGMTAVIDRLERAGYVRRRPDRRDRRKVVVEGTDQLAIREDEIFGELLRSTRAFVASYSESELVTIRDFLERSRAVIEAQARPGASSEGASTGTARTARDRTASKRRGPARLLPGA
jgi:DNA-binding MarR family transcriptional regulator